MKSITPEILLQAYAGGIFPMSEDAESDEVFWVDPDMRGIFPLDGLHISKSLRKFIRQDKLRVTVNNCFATVMMACAEPAPGRESTWINDTILDAYSRLHVLGFAHSVEVWDPEDTSAPVGGLYGVSIGGAFFGESMFSRRSNASKLALCHLVARMIKGGFQLLDTQFLTDHLASLGAVEIEKPAYHRRLNDALQVRGDFQALGKNVSGKDILAVIDAFAA